MQHPPPNLGGTRYSLKRRLGEGGFGVVYEAFDAKYAGPVAVKLLRSEHPAGITRFKREFRSLADVLHPNLVRLYELGAEHDRWYFTMELVAGKPFVEHSRAIGTSVRVAATQPLVGAASAQSTALVPETDIARLRATMVQLAEGVHALHDARKLHCDLKPGNVLVTNDGRVVILDFGLVAEVDERITPMGTPGYVSPEQARGGTLTPASDWFSVGAMLHEALTGVVPGAPFRGDIASDASDLWQLCRELIELEPARRPDGAEVLRRLGGRVRRGGPRHALVGRTRELAQLEDARRAAAHGPVLVRVTGPSGIGKSMLVRSYLDELRRRDPDTVILAGRSYEQELVPYKAVDGMVEGLAAHLDALPDEVAQQTRALEQLFPALAPQRPRTAGDDDPGMDSQARRHRAFRALRDVVSALAVRAPVVCFLDDLQWGDVDSARLLRELLRPPRAPALLVIACYREHESVDGFLAAFDEDRSTIDERTLRLGELAREDALRLAEDMLGADQHALAASIAGEAGGSPIFIEQLADRALSEGSVQPALSLGQLILDRVGALDDAARRLVAAVAVAGAPIPEDVALRASEIDASLAREATLAIRHARLVTTRTVDATVVLEPAHDRVRETLSSSLGGDARRAHHRRLADAFLARGAADPETLVRHFLGAEDDARTREFALLAADRAEQALAFDRAAGHLALILKLTAAGAADRGALLERHGEALANAGRSGEAAEAFQSAADARGEDPATIVLRRRAAELSLRSGRLEIGRERIASVLRDVGASAPRSRRTASLLSLGRRARLFARGLRVKTPRTADDCDPAALARLDALWCASTGMSMFDHVHADAIGLEHLLDALALGERSRVIRGLGYEAAFEAVLGGAFLERRCQRILGVMDELASAADTPYDRAWAQMSRGVTSWFVGDWRESWRSCDAAAAMYREHCRGVAWELAICDAYRLPALAYRGELAELAAVVPSAFAAARDRGDLFAANTLRLGQQSMVLLAANRADDAIAEAAAAIAPFPREIYLLPHYHHLFALAQASLYRGDPEVAWQRIEQEWRELSRARLLMVQCLRVEIRHLRARTALALAVRDADQRAPLLKAATAEAKAIARDRVRIAAPLASAIRAGIANVRGELDEAATHLDAAVDGFAAAGMALYEHAARARRGALRAGSDGEADRAAAATWMAAQGVRDPDAMTAMLVPGV